MPVTVVNNTKVWQRYDTATRMKIWLGWIIGTAITLLCWQLISNNTRWEFVADASQQLSAFLQRMFPPDWAYAEQLWKPLWDTITIATLGTLLAMSIALPLSFVAARNTTPHPILRYVALLIIVISRSVNSLIWALILVAITGPGVLAGILAIALRSIGFIGKLAYESIEETSYEPIEAITATGANRLQVLDYAYLPQVLPSFAGISIFRWDINIREATVLGLVGAGGIGLNLNASVDLLRWDRVGMIFILIFALVLISETLSARVRKAII
ncbi:MAG: phosphonate ABC transporter, permease protein PhnE [Chloroflexi bacterium]|jgi:phosphonate transport system permease protein|uniref:phosphonate ABC transporter, permease protein PhnE n=1 Tax=Candidatus Roseilinea sp. NK_OTU-006 TaxID=2704250 RepID=UPI000F107BCA|nr:MAG: phosphonate ABC transporter, permease protein PhnE [Chloroflexota bacterium]